jgi:two-component system, chemotaxis family, chemotaxis protein CheY
MNPRVLLVDDEPDVRFMTRLTLTRAGWELTEAGSGDEALSLAAEASFDAIVLDQRMPGLTGIETARELRSAQRHTCPIVLFSAYLTPEVARDAEQLELCTLDKAAVRELDRTLKDLLGTA